MLSAAIRAAESRTNDPDARALALLLRSLNSGERRIEALIALNRDGENKRSPYAALPSEEDHVSAFRKGFEQFAIRPLMSIALLFVAVILIPLIGAGIRRRKSKKSNNGAA